ncbi:MAG: hypothetical protein PHE84_09990 [bacterium]|nr:hypothetical protein [bacterium]
MKIPRPHKQPKPAEVFAGHGSLFLVVAILLAPLTAAAGPPYVTDDPEPVECGHWEFYAATQHTLTEDDLSGTAPHFEVNYGALPGLQVHLIAPLAYDRPQTGSLRAGIGDVELGVKLRLLNESRRNPMIGIFPLYEIPTGNEAKGLGAGHSQAFFPLWLQKSFGPWTTYGGGGYWVNPGAGHRNWWFLGWLLQRQLSRNATLGAEIFHRTADLAGGKSDTAFNIGSGLDLSEHHHLLFSAGRSIRGGTRLQGYAAYQLTI